jgi:hypothetical protein
MPDPALLPERIFGLAAIDGRRCVRPGEIISFRFRAKNGSEIATPPALLVLVLPPGWSPLDPLEAEIPPVAPGSEHAITFRARPDVADASTAASPVQAALHLDTLVLGSNVVHMHVFGHPRLDGPASHVRVETTDGDALRVRAVVVNEGDAAARAVRVVVPPPPGFVAEESAIVATRAELPVGAGMAFDYEMTPLDPAAATVAIDDAYVSFDGGRVALKTAAGALLAPRLTAPQIEAERRATRLDLRIRIANAGWVAARDVRSTIELPAGWRILRGTLRADGAPATLRRDGESENGVAVVLPLVPARGHVDVTVVASAARPRVEGEAVVRCGGHAASLTIPLPLLRALRLDARPESAFAEPGTSVAVAVDVQNTGETSERVAVALDGTSVWSGELRPGAAAAFVTRQPIPAEAADGDLLAVNVSAAGDDGTELAGTHFIVRALDRPWIAVDSVVWEGGRTRVTVRNVGATAARDIRLDGETEPLVALLGPGQSAAVIVPPEIARTAALVGTDGRRVPIGWDDQLRPVALKAALLAPASVRSGERLDVRLQCTAAEAVQTIRVRPRAHAAATYVSGSTTVNGHAVVDGVDGPPLFGPGGLALHDVPPGTLVSIAWSLLPRTPGETIVAVDLEANGVTVEVEPLTVGIADAPPFGVRPSALPFHIDAATVGEFSIAAPFAGEAAVLPPVTSTAIGALPAAPEPSAPEAFALAPAEPPADETSAFPLAAVPAVTTWLTLDAVRTAAIVRVLRGARGPGLVSHIPSLAALFPAGITSGDETLDASFARTSEAIRGIYERLFVKLRIPGYDVTAADLEDAAARRELLDLLGRIAVAPAPAQAMSVPADMHVRIDARRIAARSVELAAAPLGGPHTLAAVAMLLPREGRGDAAAAVGAYAGALSITFDAACALTPAAFTAYAASEPVPELDAARRIAIAVLDARNELTSP